jgi:hypothetical protein
MDLQETVRYKRSGKTGGMEISYMYMEKTGGREIQEKWR